MFTRFQDLPRKCTISYIRGCHLIFLLDISDLDVVQLSNEKHKVPEVLNSSRVWKLITSILPSLIKGIHPLRLNLSISVLMRCTHSLSISQPRRSHPFQCFGSTTLICPYNHTVIICVCLPQMD